MHHVNHAETAIQAIDSALAAPPVPVDEALIKAVEYGRMTPEEAQECLEAYLRHLGEVPVQVEWIKDEIGHG